jgi:hypothetical protein
MDINLLYHLPLARLNTKIFQDPGRKSIHFSNRRAPFPPVKNNPIAFELFFLSEEFRAGPPQYFKNILKGYCCFNISHFSSQPL